MRTVLESYQATQRPMEPTETSVDKLKNTVAGFLGRGGDEGAGGRPVLVGKLEASQLPGTNQIQVAYTGLDPEWGAQFVNDFLKIHLEKITELDEKEKVGEFFREQSQIHFDRWQEAQENLNAFRRQHGDDVLGSDESQLRRIIAELEASRVATETKVLEQQAKVDFLTTEIGLHPDTIAAESRVTENESVKLLNSRILELEMQRSEHLSRYTPTSTIIQDLDRRIEEARRLLETKERETLSEIKTVLNPAYQNLEIQLVEARSQLSAAEARVEALNTQIAEYREKLAILDSTSAEYERLQEDLEGAREAYQSSTRSAEEARLSNSLDEAGILNILVEDAAEPPKEPEPNNNALVVVAGTVFGLVFGVVLAFLRDWLDPSIKGSTQAHRLSGLPVIAEIPTR